MSTLDGYPRSPTAIRDRLPVAPIELKRGNDSKYDRKLDETALIPSGKYIPGLEMRDSSLFCVSGVEGLLPSLLNRPLLLDAFKPYLHQRFNAGYTDAAALTAAVCRLDAEIVGGSRPGDGRVDGRPQRRGRHPGHVGNDVPGGCVIAQPWGLRPGDAWRDEGTVGGRDVLRHIRQSQERQPGQHPA